MALTETRNGLLYREDIDDVRDRLTRWWQGGDLGRPAMQLTAPRDAPLEVFDDMPQPEGWQTNYSTRNYAYRVHLAKVAPTTQHFLGEAVPCTSPDLAPNCLALYLGCRGTETFGTVWCNPFIDDPDEDDFGIDEENFYWQFSQRLGKEMVALNAGRAHTSFPDLIEGLDTLEAMRGAERLILDLYDRPDWVHACLTRITDYYFHYYDRLYELIKDETGGSNFWAWAPGRMAKLQCDFSAMIGPDMYGELMVPVLERMCSRLDHCMYHWDGPDAIPHLDHLLGIADLDMIQWTPGAGQPPTDDPQWWPLYHRIFAAGKKAFIGVQSRDNLAAVKKEFGDNFKQFLIRMNATSPQDADELLRLAEV